MPKEGDLFAVDLDNIAEHAYKASASAFLNKKGRYAFGRIIETDPGTGAIIELFKYAGPYPEKPAEITAKGRLFSPVNVTALCFTAGRWKIIQHDPGFDKQKAGYAQIKLVMGLPPLLKLWHGGHITSITEKEAAGLESYDICFPEEIETRILKAVAGL